MTLDSELVRRPVGRPRRYSEDVERDLLLEAGIEVLQRNGFASASVADVLVVAGVSTRAFYRHFDSKDALLLAIYRREAEGTAAALEQAVELEEDVVGAIQVWLITFLDLFRNRRKVQRVAAMISSAARRTAGYEEQEAQTKELHVSSLAKLLLRAAKEGRIDCPLPRRSAVAIYAIVISCVDRPGEPLTSRQYAQAREIIDRFVWRALGVSGPPTP